MKTKMGTDKSAHFYDSCYLQKIIIRSEYRLFLNACQFNSNQFYFCNMIYFIAQLKVVIVIYLYIVSAIWNTI